MPAPGSGFAGECWKHSSPETVLADTDSLLAAHVGHDHQATRFSVANRLRPNQDFMSASSCRLPVLVRRPSCLARLRGVKPIQTSVSVRKSVDRYKSTSKPGSIEQRSTSLPG